MATPDVIVAVSLEDEMRKEAEEAARKKALQHFKTIEAELQPGVQAGAVPTLPPSPTGLPPPMPALPPMTGAPPAAPAVTPAAAPGTREYLTQAQTVLGRAGAGIERPTPSNAAATVATAQARLAPLIEAGETVQQLGARTREAVTERAQTAEQAAGGVGLGEAQARGYGQPHERQVPPLTKAVSPPPAPNPLEGLGAVMKLADVPRQWLKENIWQPIIEHNPTHYTREALEKVGVPSKVAGVIAGGGPWGVLSEDEQAEGVSWVLDPVNLAMAPGTTLEAARAVARSSPKIARIVAERLGESEFARAMGEAVVRGEAGLAGKAGGEAGEEAAQALGREGLAPERAAAGEVPPVRPPVEPPPPTEGPPPFAPLDDSSRTLDYFLGAPKSEKAQRTLIRRYEGQVGEELSEADVAIGQLRAQAAAAGLKFSDKPTRDVPAIMDVLDYPGSVDEAIAAVGLTGEEATLARGLRTLLDKETALLRRDVPDFSLREFYFPHEFAKPPKGIRVFQGRPIGAKPGFTRARRLEGTLGQILEDRPDLALYSGDPISVVNRRLYQGALYRQQFVLTSQMKRVGLAVRRSEALLRPEGLMGWRTPREVVSFNPRPISGKPGIFTEPWVVPEELASAIEDNFGRSAFTTNIPLNVLRQTVAGLKFAKTFGGLFQHIDYSMRALGSATRFGDLGMVATIPRAFYRGFFPGANAKWLEWEMTSSAPGAIARRALLKHGLNAQAGLSFMGKEYEAMAKEFFVYRTPFVGRALKAFGSGTFVNAHREYMLDIGEKLVLRYQRQGMTLDEAAAKVALDMNERFSSLPAWQSVLRNPTTRDVVRTGLFSMAEQESWIRMPFRQKAFLTSILVNTIALSNMISLMTTGKLLPPEAYIPFVRNKESPTGVDYNVRFLRPQLPWRGPDGRLQYLDLLGQADTPMRMALSPQTAVITRLGQVPSIAGQVVAGKSSFGGQPLEDWRDIGLFLAEQVSPIPAAGFWSEKQRIGLTGAAIQATGLNVSAERLSELRNRTATEEVGKPYDEFTRQEKLDWRKKHPEQFATSADLPEGTPIEQALALSEERAKRIGALGVKLENGEITGSQYGAMRGDIVQEIAARRSEIPTQDYQPKTDEEKALDTYYRTLDARRTASPTGLLQGEDWDAAEQAVLDELGEKGQQALLTALAASGDRVEKVYLEDRLLNTQARWNEINDLIWQQEAATRGLPSADKKYSEVLDAVADALQESGIEPTATQVERTMRDRGWGDVLDAMTAARIQARINHPDLDARLLRWGTNGVTTARSEKAMDLFKTATGREIRPASTGLFKFNDGRVVDGLGSWCDSHEHDVCRLLGP
jgi:hypothetical protein